MRLAAHDRKEIETFTASLHTLQGVLMVRRGQHHGVQSGDVDAQLKGIRGRQAAQPTVDECLLEGPAVLAGDYNVVPTDGKHDIYSAASWKQDALLQPESRAAWRTIVRRPRASWTR